MANLSLREVNQSKLETTPIVEGQLVFCYDTGNIYHDTTSGRTQVGHDVFNVTELPLAPLNGKVYCLPDGEMLLYLGDWVKLNYKYDVATETEDGLQSAADKIKLDGIASGANKTVVDNALSQGSANPVANSAITKRLQYLYSFKISRDKWNESSDKSNWNVIVSWSDSKGNAITATASSATPNLTTGMSLGPAMMERTSSLSDNIILSGELSMINQGQIYVCETNKLSFTIKRRPVCDLMLYFYARQWTV